ncbi:protein of unknown function [Chryseobacterium sp. JV274]|nr:protein of unknown function [Chryseobacterium sp. JV274]
MFFYSKKYKYVCEIFKKKLNLLKQKYYEKISTALFIFFSHLDFFIFTRSATQETRKGNPYGIIQKGRSFY